MGGNDTDTVQDDWFTAGLLALILLILNAAIFLWMLVSAGHGVDAGIGIGGIFALINLPLLVVSTIAGIVGVVKRRGRLPGVVALVICGGLILTIVWGFVSTQIL